ncbi:MULTISPECIES: VOC family protein [unclassified Microbacterium]|uniref:VOC family protein n=1 Tax=unclassified Microbacterium TaxID=2609290 RepID=UPI0011B0192F|nr:MULTISPECIES: VOC family protein [unclassified Microbacterium]
MSFSLHLTYAGDCQQAIDLYVTAFNADVQSMSTYSEMRIAIPPGMEDRIACAVLALDGGYLHLSDSLGHDNMKPCSRIALLVEGTPTQVQQAQGVLLEEGSRLPTASAGPGAFACTILDRFGVTWQLIDTEHTE